MSRGYFFTGYGYYYRNRWYSFSGQSSYAKRQMCANTFSLLGYRCPYSAIQLICFRAGGYPKTSCQDYCRSKKGVYTPQPTHPPLTPTIVRGAYQAQVLPTTSRLQRARIRNTLR